jgi:plasmid stabilization system protein ParE
MTPLEFTEFAKADLVDIETYYSKVAPASLGAILSDIYSMVDIISQWPKVGRDVEGENFQQIATPKYGYVIAYQLTETQIEIEGIFRHQNRTK